MVDDVMLNKVLKHTDRTLPFVDKGSVRVMCQAEDTAREIWSSMLANLDP